MELFTEKFDASPFKIGVIGPGTERAIEEQGWKVSFSPKSTNPKEGIDEFAEMLPKSETVIMACSDKSLKRMHGLVSENQLIEWEFYENISKKHISKSEADYLIFTSPSNADAYLNLFELNINQVVVSIGKTTDAALEKRGVLNRIRAEHPAEESIWEAILKNRVLIN